MDCIFWLLVFIGLFGLLAIVPLTLTIITGIGFIFGKLTKKETKLIIKKIWA